MKLGNILILPQNMAASRNTGLNVQVFVYKQLNCETPQYHADISNKLHRKVLYQLHEELG